MRIDLPVPLPVPTPPHPPPSQPMSFFPSFSKGSPPSHPRDSWTRPQTPPPKHHQELAPLCENSPSTNYLARRVLWGIFIFFLLVKGPRKRGRRGWFFFGRFLVVFFFVGFLFRRRTNVQQLTCKIDLSKSFYYLFFSFVLIELKPFVLKGKVPGEKFWKSAKKC